MVLKINDQQFMLDFARRIIEERLAIINSILKRQADGECTPAQAWCEIQEVMNQT